MVPDTMSQQYRSGNGRYSWQPGDMPLGFVPTTSARLLALLSLLQTRRDWPGTVLADRLAVSTAHRAPRC